MRLSLLSVESGRSARGGSSCAHSALAVATHLYGTPHVGLLAATCLTLRNGHTHKREAALAAAPGAGSCDYRSAAGKKRSPPSDCGPRVERKRRRRAAQSYRPQLEPLEPRQLLTGTVADNGDAITIIDDVANDFTGAFTQTGFSYQNNSLVADAYDGDNHNMRGSEGTATWTFDNLEEGEYHVAATWAHKYGNKYNAPDAPFTLRDGETQRSQVLVNQQNLPAEFTDEQEVTWDTLDTISVTSGTLRVELSEAPGNNYVVADAIRIERLGEASPTVTVTVAADSVTEGDGAAATTGTLSLGNATSSDLIVNLNSDDTSEATVPASVTVRAGENSATFEIVAMDDNDSDGTQNVVITASADGFLDGSDTLEVTDDEPAILAIIDNTNEASAAFTQTNFEYKTGTSAYEADNHNWRKNSGPGEAVWTFKNMQNGEYQVAATWYEKYNRATDAPFTIENGSGEVLTTASVNQKNRPDDFTEGGTRWEQLATVNVNDGLLVVRANGSPTNSGYVVADAIRINSDSLQSFIHSFYSSSIRTSNNQKIFISLRFYCSLDFLHHFCCRAEFFIV